eukprot:COSAG05_NODE_10708_length_550_cov_1.011086_1_plen_58_part_00
MQQGRGLLVLPPPLLVLVLWLLGAHVAARPTNLVFIMADGARTRAHMAVAPRPCCSA